MKLMRKETAHRRSRSSFNISLTKFIKNDISVSVHNTDPFDRRKEKNLLSDGLPKQAIQLRRELTLFTSSNSNYTKHSPKMRVEPINSVLIPYHTRCHPEETLEKLREPDEPEPEPGPDPEELDPVWCSSISSPVEPG